MMFQIKTVDNYSMVCTEATTAGVDRVNVSSKIGERVEKSPIGYKSITVEVGATRVSSWIKIG